MLKIEDFIAALEKRGIDTTEKLDRFLAVIHLPAQAIELEEKAKKVRADAQAAQTAENAKAAQMEADAAALRDKIKVLANGK